MRASVGGHSQRYQESFQEARRHLRKISQIIQTGDSFAQVKASVEQPLKPCLEQGDTEESEVPPDSERELIAGQRLSVIRSILQKMLKTQA